MGKLGKKARKFAKKNLQGVLRQRRKNKAFLFKKKNTSSIVYKHSSLIGFCFVSDNWLFVYQLLVRSLFQLVAFLEQ